MTERTRHILIKAGKIIAWIVGSILLLLLIAVVLVRIPGIQNAIVDSVEQQLKKTLNTKLSVGHVYLNFPTTIEIASFYLEDQQADTLLYFNTLEIEANLWELLNRKIEIDYLGLTGIKGKIYRYDKEDFNYEFLLNAEGGSDTSEQENSDSWTFNLEEIKIDSLQFYFDDRLQSTSIRANWHSLFVSVDELDMSEPKLFIDEIRLSGAIATYTIDETSDSNTANTNDESENTFNLKIDNIEISDSRVAFNNPQQTTRASLGLLAVQAEYFDLPNSEVRLEELELKNSSFNYKQKKFRDASEVDSAVTANDWKVSLNRLKLSDNDLKIDLDSLESKTGTFNAQNLAIRKLHGEIKNIFYSQNKISTVIDTLHFLTDNQPVQVKSDFSMDDRQLQVQNMVVSSQKSHVNVGLTLSYTSLGELISNNTKVDLGIARSDLHRSDLVYFLPDLANVPVPNSLSLEGKAEGRIENIEIDRLLATTGQSSLFMKGSIQKPMDPAVFSYNLDSLSLLVGQPLTKLYVPDSLSIELPKRMRLIAKGSGSTTDFKGKAELRSEYGNVTVNAEKLSFGNDNLAFSVSSKTSGFDVGKLVGEDEILDDLQFSLSASGSGADIQSMLAKVTGNIENIAYNGYTYDELKVGLDYNESMIKGTIDLRDPHLELTIFGDLDVTPEAHKNNLTVDLEKAHLEPLNFSNTPLNIEGVLTSNFTTSDFRHFNGDVALRNFTADNQINKYHVDSLIVVSIDQIGKTEITINSDIAVGEFNGNVDVYGVGKALKEHINQYYDLRSVVVTESPEVNFEFKFNLLNTDLLTEIILPPLNDFRPGRFEAKFNSLRNTLDVELGINHFEYDGFIFDSLKIEASSNNKALNSSLSLQSLSSANTAIENLSLTNKFSNDVLSTAFSITDSLGATQYLIQALSTSVDSTYQVRLDADSLILDYDRWQVNQNQPLVFGNPNETPEVSLKLTRNDQGLTFKTNVQDSALHVMFDEFLLSTLGKIITKNEGVVQGTLNGQVDLLVYTGEFDVLANLNVKKLTVLDRIWGSLDLRIEPLDRKLNKLTAFLKSMENDLTITSEYDLNNFDDLSLVAHIEEFQLGTLEPLLKENLETFNGQLSGNIRLANGFDTPDLNGSVRLKDAACKPVALNTTFLIKNGGMAFDNSVIQFNDFQLKDKLDHLATVNGTVDVVSTTFANLDLKVSTNDFLVLNTTKADNELYYGKISVDGNVFIRGSTSRPTITSTIRLSKNSNLTYVIPETEYNALNTNDVVQFVSYGEEQISSSTDSLENTVDFEGLNLSAQLEIDKSSVFTIIVDPVTQDQLTVRGEATLNANINRVGDMKLSGRYVVDEGSYNFSFYNLLKRKFIIEEGSSIIWTGDPYSANLDLRAYNRVEAAPIDLLVNQVSNVSSAELNQYRQRLPFLVYINIDGELMQPQIGFELDMPDQNKSAFGGLVYSRIQDLNSRESDLNKQVFSLLLLQRFFSDDPLNSEGGYDLEDKARRSVSRILSDQLNRLTDNINGVNLNLDLQSYQDYSNGSSQGTTQLELGVSKNLFNDRLEVKVAGNVNLEGSEQQRLSDYVGDLALEYKITDDGRLRIIGFRRSDFDVLSGEIVETGAGLIYVRDYNTFKELFRGSNEK